MLFLVGLWMIGQLFATLQLPLLLIFVALLLAGGTPNGVHIVYNVSRSIAQQRQSGQYELIGITPAGRFVAGWALAARHVRLHHGYIGLSQFALLFQLFALLLIFPVGLVLAPALTSPAMVGVSISAASPDGLMIVFNGLMLVLMLRLEYMRSITSAVLLSILVPARGNAGIAALWIFLSLQIAVYLSYGLVVFGGIGTLVTQFPLDGILSSLLFVGTFILIAEGFNRVLWGMLQTELNTGEAELEGLAVSANWVFPVMG